MAEKAALKENQELCAQIEEVRAQIADALLEIDQILLQTNPQIEADYAVKIGCYENELLQAQIAARRAKRKLALAQARANRGQAVDTTELEAQLDEEFEAWEAQLELQVNAYLQKLEDRIGSRPLGPADTKELRRLHRELVKRLHPDLHPAQTAEETRLFAVAQGAFEQGDLDALRSVEAATRYLAGADASNEGTPDALYAEYELLCAQLRITQERLEKLKGSVPYTLGEKLSNATWVHRRVEELKTQTAEQEEVGKAYVQKYRELTEGRNV